MLVLIGLGVLTGRLIHSRSRAQDVRVDGPVPYTVILRETVHRPDGTATVVAEELWAIRSDGSRALRLTHKGEYQTTERMINFASGIEVTTNERTNTKSTVAKPINPASWLRDPESKCIDSLTGEPFTSPPEVTSGEEMVAGHRTVKITRGIVTRWLALDYGCAIVKSRADWGSQGFSEWNLLALIPGEPDAALFQIAQYREVPPSERTPGSGENPNPPDPATAERVRKLDEYYYAHRPEQQR